VIVPGRRDLDSVDTTLVDHRRVGEGSPDVDADGDRGTMRGGIRAHRRKTLLPLAPGGARQEAAGMKRALAPGKLPWALVAAARAADAVEYVPENTTQYPGVRVEYALL
jgi:hypothetical protein